MNEAMVHMYNMRKVTKRHRVFCSLVISGLVNHQNTSQPISRSHVNDDDLDEMDTRQILLELHIVFYGVLSCDQQQLCREILIYLQLSITNGQCWVSIGYKRKSMSH